MRVVRGIAYTMKSKRIDTLSVKKENSKPTKVYKVDRLRPFLPSFDAFAATA